MRIDFSSMDGREMPCLWEGTGTMFSKMHMDEKGNKYIEAAIHPGGSFGLHEHRGSMDIVYVLEGKGVAECDGKCEELHPGVCHVCPDGSKHSFRNVGDGDLVVLTFVPKV